jgi:subtilisin-like proprotein convertase family protein
MAKIVLEYWPLKPIQAQYLSELCMRSPFWLATLFAATCFLAACGGGGGGGGPETTSNPASKTAVCELPLQYANGSNGGYTIKNTLTESVPRQFNTCPIQTIKSASVSLCLDHPDISELTAQLRMPNNITVALDLQKAQPGETCLILGTSFSIPVPINGLPLPSSADRNWTVGVTDTNSVTTQAGYLVGWSMKVEGLE